MIIYQIRKKYKVFFGFAAKGRETRGPCGARIVIFQKKMGPEGLQAGEMMVNLSCPIARCGAGFAELLRPGNLNVWRVKPL